MGATEPESRSTGGAPTALARRPNAHTVLVALRPRQWVKNVLVFAAPASAGVLVHASAALRALAAAAIFVAASSATYLVNDVVDAPADRLHPLKRQRPVASGALSPAVALGVAAALLALALAGAVLLALPLLLVVVAYIAVTFGYSLAMKRVPVVELAFVSAGFVLRAAAGGAAARVAISPWFLIVTSCLALFVVAGKRSAELSTLGASRGEHRASLASYTPEFLRSVRLLVASVAVTSYCLWVFQRADRIHGHHLAWFEISVIPFVLAVLSVEHAIESGRGGEPEELALHDRMLQALGLCWSLAFALGVYR